MELVPAVDAYITNTLGLFIRWSYSRLMDAQKWKDLADCTNDFNSEVNRHLTGVKMAMRLLFAEARKGANDPASQRRYLRRATYEDLPELS